MKSKHTISDLISRSPFGPIQVHMEKSKECAEELLVFLDAVIDNDWNNANKSRKKIKALEKEFKVNQITKPKTGTTAHSKKKHKDFEKKVARMKRLYLKLKEKGYTEKQCYNLISDKYYPDHTPSTVDTYINKK